MPAKRFSMRKNTQGAASEVRTGPEQPPGGNGSAGSVIQWSASIFTGLARLG